MVKVRWVSSSIKGEGSSEKCFAMAGNRVRRGGSDRNRERCVVGCFFVLSDMADSPTIILLLNIWSGFEGVRTIRLNFGSLMSKHARTYDEK